MSERHDSQRGSDPAVAQDASRCQREDPIDAARHSAPGAPDNVPDSGFAPEPLSEEKRAELRQRFAAWYVVRRYAASREMLMRILRRHPIALDLVNPRRGGNPGLVAALATAMEAAPDDAARDALADMVTRPRRFVARVAGLPSGPAALAALARLAPEDCTPDIIEDMRHVLEQPELRRRLARLPMVTRVAVSVAGHAGLLDWLGDDLIRETATYRDERVRDFVSRLYAVAWSRTRRGERRPVHSLDELQQEADADHASADFAPFPPPPFEEHLMRGVLTPIRSVAELRRAASELRNCAMTYLESITRSQTRYLYWVEGSPRGMALLRRELNAWHLMQVRGPGNCLLEPERVERIRTLIERANRRSPAAGLRGQAIAPHPRHAPFPPPLGITAIDEALRERHRERDVITIGGNLLQARRLALHWAMRTLLAKGTGTLEVLRDRFADSLLSRVQGWMTGLEPRWIPGALANGELSMVQSAALRLERYCLREVRGSQLPGDGIVSAAFGAPLVLVWYEDPDEPLTLEHWQALQRIANQGYSTVFLASWSSARIPTRDGSRGTLAVPEWSLQVRPHLLDEETQVCRAVSLHLRQRDRAELDTHTFARCDAGGCFVGA